jgi:hypothetical protein
MFVALSLVAAAPARAQTPAAPAHAQTPAAPGQAGQAHFDEAIKHYNLGRFAEAIAEFEKAYDADPAPILLFNIAQSHRQLGNKEKALFFYRRYIEQAPDAPNRPEVEQRMKDLAQSLEQEKELKQRPPTEVARQNGPAGGTVGGAPMAGPEVATSTTSAANAGTTGSASWAVLGYVAPSFTSVSGQDIDIPMQLAIRIGGAYAFPLPSAQLTVGLDGVLAFVPYQTTDGGNGTSTLPGILATGAYMRDVAPKLSIGAGVGAGVIWWSGLGSSSVIAPSVSVAGAIAMPSVEAELRATFAVLPQLFVVLAPQVLYSKPTSGLEQDISALWRFNINVGAGYRF